MIKVSDRAGRVLSETRKAHAPDEGKIMRLQAQGDGEFRLAMDDPKPTDNIIKHGDAPVLAVDKALEEELPDSLIDVRDTPEGVRISIRTIPPHNSADHSGA